MEVLNINDKDLKKFITPQIDALYKNCDLSIINFIKENYNDDNSILALCKTACVIQNVFYKDNRIGNINYGAGLVNIGIDPITRETNYLDALIANNYVSTALCAIPSELQPTTLLLKIPVSTFDKENPTPLFVCTNNNPNTSEKMHIIPSEFILGALKYHTPENILEFSYDDENSIIDTTHNIELIKNESYCDEHDYTFLSPISNTQLGKHFSRKNISNFVDKKMNTPLGRFQSTLSNILSTLKNLINKKKNIAQLPEPSKGSNVNKENNDFASRLVVSTGNVNTYYENHLKNAHRAPEERTK